MMTNASDPIDPTTRPGATDAVNRWATEHYGFDDEPGAAAVSETSAMPPSSRPGARIASGPRHRLLLGAGVLALLVAGGAGGAAVADAAGGDGAGGGRNGGAQFQINQYNDRHDASANPGGDGFGGTRDGGRGDGPR
jgi:hypothetical protein